MMLCCKAAPPPPPGCSYAKGLVTSCGYALTCQKNEEKGGSYKCPAGKKCASTDTMGCGFLKVVGYGARQLCCSPLDCKVSDWFGGKWDKCTKLCGGGTQKRAATRTISDQPRYGGKACPKALVRVDARSCNTKPCQLVTDAQQAAASARRPSPSPTPTPAPTTKSAQVSMARGSKPAGKAAAAPSSGLSAGAIVGIVIGVVAVLAIGGAVIACKMGKGSGAESQPLLDGKPALPTYDEVANLQPAADASPQV